MITEEIRPVPYRRMSDHKQDNSPTRQAQVIREWSRREGIPLIEPEVPFLDLGITGTTNDREHLQRLIDTAAHQLAANAVVIDQMSRISRTDALEAAAEVYLPLRRSGIRYVIDASKGTIHDLHDTNCILFVTIEQGHGSHAESRSIAHRVATGLKSLREQGYFFGPKPPPGYIIVDRRQNKFGHRGCGKLSIDPDTAPKIKDVFYKYLKLRSARRVAQATGLRVYQVDDILNQPIYCGRLEITPRRSIAKFESVTGVKLPGEKTAIYRNKDERQYKDGVYPKIVPTQVWDSCQAIRKANRNSGLKRQFRGYKYKGKLY